MENKTTTQQRVVIVGAGFGGLEAAKRLSGKPGLDVTVVDKRNHHTFQPLLYQVATAGLDSDDICYATRGIFQKHDNVRAVQGTVTGVDFEAQLVRTKEGPALPYDHLILALGAVTADYGVPGVADHAFGLKSAADAMALRNHVLRRFEKAARFDDPVRRDAATTVVVVGGGPTGVEMAGGLAELMHKVLRKDYPEFIDQPLRVVLVEGQDRLLGTFSTKASRRAEARLAKMGVEVRTGVGVVGVTADAIAFDDGTTLGADTVVWAAGVKANPIAAALDLETGQGGRVIVDEHLRLPEHDDVFVIGDLAAVPWRDGQLVPQVAPGAIQQGAHAATAIADGTEGLRPFTYRDKGSMATIGRNAAVVEFPNGRGFGGFAGWLAWLGLHLVMLVGVRNRLNVLINWAWNYLTWDRASRIVVEPEPS